MSKLFYRVVAPYMPKNEYGNIVAGFDTKEEAKNFVREHSKREFPFDSRFLMIETRLDTFDRV